MGVNRGYGRFAPIARSRKEAIKMGLHKYHTGKPCINGHTTDRLVSSKACVMCNRKSYGPKTMSNGQDKGMTAAELREIESSLSGY